jgi:PilZ domain-containing protein
MTDAALPTATLHRDSHERRKHLRKGTLWHGTLRTPEGSLACNVLNLSVRGAKIEVAGVTKGQTVTLVMDPLGEFTGTVMWQHDGQAGIRINEHRTLHDEITLPRSLAGAHFNGDC